MTEDDIANYRLSYVGSENWPDPTAEPHDMVHVYVRLRDGRCFTCCIPNQKTINRTALSRSLSNPAQLAELWSPADRNPLDGPGPGETETNRD